jgi:hypothetical protein
MNQIVLNKNKVYIINFPLVKIPIYNPNIVLDNLNLTFTE